VRTSLQVGMWPWVFLLLAIECHLRLRGILMPETSLIRAPPGSLQASSRGNMHERDVGLLGSEVSEFSLFRSGFAVFS
jgi:hypothetical protein